MSVIPADILKRYERKGRIIGAAVGLVTVSLCFYVFVYDFDPLPKIQKAPLSHFIAWLLVSLYVALICSHLGRIVIPYIYHLKEQVKVERRKFQSK